MKTLLISGLTVALLTGGAFAQASDPPPAPPAQGPAAAGPAPAPPPAGLAAARPPPPGGPEVGDDLDGPPPPPPGGPGPRGQRPPPPPRGAHFRLQRGDAMIDVKCADGEPMRACADVALQMVDRLQSMQRP